MRWLTWYFAQLRNLMAPADSLDPGDVGGWLARRSVARLMMLPIALPVVLGGFWGWDAYKDHRRTAALEASPCHLDDSAVLGLGSLETSGYVSGRRCDLYWSRDGRTLLSVAWMPSGGMGQTVVDRWDWDRPERVEVVKDGGGNRFLVVRPVDEGRLEVRVESDEVSEARVVTAYLDR